MLPAVTESGPAGPGRPETVTADIVMARRESVTVARAGGLGPAGVAILRVRSHESCGHWQGSESDSDPAWAETQLVTSESLPGQCSTVLSQPD